MFLQQVVTEILSVKCETIDSMLHSETTFSLAVKIFIYLHKQHQHPRCDHSCEIQNLDGCTGWALIHCLCTWHHPTRWALSPARRLQLTVLTGLGHSPAVYTPPEHQPGPMNHHTPSPTVRCGRSLLDQRRSCFHWPDGPAPQLLSCCAKLCRKVL